MGFVYLNINKKVYGDKRIEVIFGGGTSIIEEL